MQNNQNTPDNTRFYDQFRQVPDTAKKPITEGRLKNKTDINPMWRIKRLTEVYGPCGFGWKYTIKRTWTETMGENTAAAFMDIELYVKDPQTGEWSAPIPGNGGNVLKRVERNGNLFLNDDAYKMCLTDAISVASKALGLAADVYFEQDVTKYSYTPKGITAKPTVQQPVIQTAGDPMQNGPKPVLNPASPHWNANVAKVAGTNDSIPNIRTRIEKVYTISEADFNNLMRAAGRMAS